LEDESKEQKAKSKNTKQNSKIFDFLERSSPA